MNASDPAGFSTAFAPHPPLESVWSLAAAPARADTLLALLPGAYHGPPDFVRAGFVQAVRARGLAVDLQLVHAHAGYYGSGQIVERLHHDVIRPARARGYARIWLCGISLGGYGALRYAAAHGSRLGGVLALAAFLGRRDLPAHVAAAGGLVAWNGELPGADPEDLALWRWLRGQARPSAGRWRVPLYMGWGEQDRFILSNRLLGAALPAGRVFTTAGGHDWPTWQRLWSAFLDRQPWRAA